MDSLADDVLFRDLPSASRFRLTLRFAGIALFIEAPPTRRGPRRRAQHRRRKLESLDAPTPPVDPAKVTYGPMEQLQVAVATAALGAQLRAAGEPGPVNEEFLAGWLARGCGDPKRALDGLQAHLAWRMRVCGPSGRVHPEQIPNQLAARKTFLQGNDLQGRPVVLVLAKRHFSGDLSEYIRLLTFTIDAAILKADPQRNPSRRVVAVVDLSSIGIRNLDVPTFKSLFDVIANQYPSHLDSFWLINAPLIFNGLWRIVSPAIHAVVRSKVRFARSRNGVCADLLQHVGKPSLPEHLGGKAACVPVEVAAGEGSGFHGQQVMSKPPLPRRPLDASPTRHSILASMPRRPASSLIILVVIGVAVLMGLVVGALLLLNTASAIDWGKAHVSDFVGLAAGLVAAPSD